MINKKDKLLELCELSEQDFKNIPINGNSRTASANVVNHKLLPIIQALLSRVESLEGALEVIAKERKSFGTLPIIARQALATSPLDALLEREGE